METPDPVPSGVPGFDVLLEGGFPAGRMYLIEGRPGTGKTTFALQFALEGAQAGERVLYVTLSQRSVELEDIAHSHGWSLDGIEVLDIETSGLDFHASDHTLFSTADVDLVDVFDTILAKVHEMKPARVVLDSAAEVRLLAGDILRSRRRFLELKLALGNAGITSLLLDDDVASDGKSDIHSIVHGVVRMERQAPEYGHLYRRLLIYKIRGVDNPTGYHDVLLDRGGVVVFPSLPLWLVPGGGDSDGDATPGDTVQTRADGVDDMLCGGLDRGASCVILGSSGTGKSSLAASYAMTAAENGERAVIYTYDERKSTLLHRMKGLGYDLRSMDPDRLRVDELSASVVTTGRFVDMVRRDVERGASVIVIDSLAGFTRACPGRSRAASRLHDLMAYLGSKGVVTLLTIPQHGVLGSKLESGLDISYIADTVIVLQHYEAEGMLRKAITVAKRRRGDHERAVRDFLLSDRGIATGDTITDYQGVLTGIPTVLDPDRDPPR